jgi:hypothetical protein
MRLQEKHETTERCFNFSDVPMYYVCKHAQSISFVPEFTVKGAVHINSLEHYHAVPSCMNVSTLGSHIRV